MLASSSSATADMYAQQQQQQQSYHDQSSTLYYLQPLSKLLAADTPHPCCALENNGCALSSYPSPPLSATTVAPSPPYTDASLRHFSSSMMFSSTHSLPLSGAQTFTYPPHQAMYMPRSLDYFDAAHAGGYLALGHVSHQLPMHAAPLPTIDSALGSVSSLLLAAAAAGAPRLTDMIYY